MEGLLRMVEDGEDSMCMCGSVGTNKTRLLHESISPVLREEYADRPKAVWVSGMTAMVRTALGGMTLDSLSGVGRGLGTLRQFMPHMHPEAKN